MTGLLLLTLLTPAQPPALQKGDELVFVGTVEEAVDRPTNRFRRKHDLEVRVLALNAGDFAVLTQLRRANDVVSGAAGVVAGAKTERAPTAARLDLLRVRSTPVGRDVLLLSPDGMPLVLGPETPLRTLPAIPLDTFAPFEFGMFPTRSGKADGEETINGERCFKQVTTTQSPDWDNPVGGQTAWQRVETVWVSGRDQTARRVHRAIRQRDGRSVTPAVAIDVKYDLNEHSHIAGRTFDRYRREVEVGFATGSEVVPLLADAVRHGPRPFEQRLKKLDEHLEENPTTTPYREGVLAVRRLLDAARRGETLPAAPLTSLVAVLSAGIAVGQIPPDFRAGSFRFADHRGKPAVLVFFKPTAETTDLPLMIADALDKLYRGRVTVVPLVVFGETAAGLKDRDRLKLSVPVYDGAAAGAAYGVDTFPRFVVTDAAGKVRWTFPGVGAETGFLVREELDKLLAPTGTGSPTAPGVPVRQARP